MVVCARAADAETANIVRRNGILKPCVMPLSPCMVVLPAPHTIISLQDHWLSLALSFTLSCLYRPTRGFHECAPFPSCSDRHNLHRSTVQLRAHPGPAASFRTTWHAVDHQHSARTRRYACRLGL